MLGPRVWSRGQTLLQAILLHQLAFRPSGQLRRCHCFEPGGPSMAKGGLGTTCRYSASVCGGVSGSPQPPADRRPDPPLRGVGERGKNHSKWDKVSCQPPRIKSARSHPHGRGDNLFRIALSTTKCRLGSKRRKPLHSENEK